MLVEPFAEGLEIVVAPVGGLAAVEHAALHRLAAAGEEQAVLGDAELEQTCLLAANFLIGTQ